MAGGLILIARGKRVFVLRVSLLYLQKSPEGWLICIHTIKLAPETSERASVRAVVAMRVRGHREPAYSGKENNRPPFLRETLRVFMSSR